MANQSRHFALLQRRVAQTAVTSSSARNMGPGGTIGGARSFFGALDLRRLRVSSEHTFRSILNQITRECQSAVQCRRPPWGAARKWTNIFLRDVIYNLDLREKYRLAGLIQWLELPLDGHVAFALSDEIGGECLNEWESVISLDWRMSRRYQKFAAEVAARNGIHRIDLDLSYWRRPERSRRVAFAAVAQVDARPGVYEIHTKNGMPLKVGISINIQERLTQHAHSYQSCLRLKPRGNWRNPRDVRSNGSILAKHLYFDRSLSAKYDFRFEHDRRHFLNNECDLFIRFTRGIVSAKRIEEEREQSGIFRYVGLAKRR